MHRQRLNRRTAVTIKPALTPPREQFQDLEDLARMSLWSVLQQIC